MAREQVKSTSIRSVEYFHANGIMDVEFTNGSRYQYLSVPEATYKAMMASKSVGQYFGTHIRSNFKSQRLTTSGGR